MPLLAQLNKLVAVGFSSLGHYLIQSLVVCFTLRMDRVKAAKGTSWDAANGSLRCD